VCAASTIDRHTSATREGLGPETGGEMKGRWAVLALIALGTFMTTLDASIVNISLPSIARTFHTTIGSAV